MRKLTLAEMLRLAMEDNRRAPLAADRIAGRREVLARPPEVAPYLRNVAPRVIPPSVKPAFQRNVPRDMPMGVSSVYGTAPMRWQPQAAYTRPLGRDNPGTYGNFADYNRALDTRPKMATFLRPAPQSAEPWRNPVNTRIGNVGWPANAPAMRRGLEPPSAPPRPPRDENSIFREGLARVRREVQAPLISQEERAQAIAEERSTMNAWNPATRRPSRGKQLLQTSKQGAQQQVNQDWQTSAPTQRVDPQTGWPIDPLTGAPVAPLEWEQRQREQERQRLEDERRAQQRTQWRPTGSGVRISRRF